MTIQEENGYAKFQYSEFTRNGHDGQYVVRTNDKAEFEMLVEYIKNKVHPIPVDPQSVASSFSPSAPGMPEVTPVSLGVCKKCGSPNMTYKSGTIGCSKYCWRPKV